MTTLGNFNSGLPRNRGISPLETQKRTCGHWPAPHMAVINGQKTQQCATCWKENKT